MSLDDRDKSLDQPCDGCGKPLWRIYPDAEEHLAWGHTSREDTKACPITNRPTVSWPVPRDTREHTDIDKWCRHPDCKDTNYMGRDRLHMRSDGCPPYAINPVRFVSKEVRAALLKRAEEARREVGLA